LNIAFLSGTRAWPVNCVKAPWASRIASLSRGSLWARNEKEIERFSGWTRFMADAQREIVDRRAQRHR
jgi:hypothetical protein